MSEPFDRPVQYVRWRDAVEDETDDASEFTGPCTREQLGWVMRDQTNQLVLVTEVVTWADGTRSFVRTIIDPDWIIERRPV